MIARHSIPGSWRSCRSSLWWARLRPIAIISIEIIELSSQNGYESLGSNCRRCMSEFSPSRIVIVGGGASGALMAAHLLRGRPKDLAVTIIETRAELGRGLAYATDNPSHLLNVRAANMSAFADDPGHFARWLSAQRDAPAAADPEFRFVSRGL